MHRTALALVFVLVVPSLTRAQEAPAEGSQAPAPAPAPAPARRDAPPMVPRLPAPAALDDERPGLGPAGEQPAPARSPGVRIDPSMRGYVEPTLTPYLGGSIPVGAELIRRPNRGLLTGGIVALAVGYGGALTYALATCGAQEDCRSGSWALYIPLIGGIVTAALPETRTTGGRALAAFDSAVQLAGLGMIVAAIVRPKTFVLWQGREVTLRLAPTSAPVALGPGIAAMSAGIGISGVNW